MSDAAREPRARRAARAGDGAAPGEPRRLAHARRAPRHAPDADAHAATCCVLLSSSASCPSSMCISSSRAARSPIRAAHAGLHDLAVDMLDEGTAARTRSQIAEDIEHLGAALYATRGLGRRATSACTRSRRRLDARARAPGGRGAASRLPDDGLRARSARSVSTSYCRSATSRASLATTRSTRSSTARAPVRRRRCIGTREHRSTRIERDGCRRATTASSSRRQRVPRGRGRRDDGRVHGAARARASAHGRTRRRPGALRAAGAARASDGDPHRGPAGRGAVGAAHRVRRAPRARAGLLPAAGDEHGAGRLVHVAA